MALGSIGVRSIFSVSKRFPASLLTVFCSSGSGAGSASLGDCDQQKQATNAANDLYGNGKSVKTKELLRAVNSIPLNLIGILMRLSTMSGVLCNVMTLCVDLMVGALSTNPCIFGCYCC